MMFYRKPSVEKRLWDLECRVAELARHQQVMIGAIDATGDLPPSYRRSVGVAYALQLIMDHLGIELEYEEAKHSVRRKEP